MNFTPNEGFMLSRINGTWDIGSLIKISPIREADALMIFYKLLKDGIIAFQGLGRQGPVVTILISEFGEEFRIQH